MTKYDLMREPLLSANIRNSLLRGTGEVLEDSEEGIFVYEPLGHVYFLMAETETGKRWLMAHEDREYDLIVLYDDALIAFAGERYGMEYDEKCKQVVWTRPEPPVRDRQLTLRPAAEADFELCRSIYHGSSDADLHGSLSAGTVLLGFWGDTLIGMVGMHTEGSMGMLEVLPAYRRRGFGTELEKALIERQLSLGLIPYGQVYLSNAASFALQASLGMECSEGTLMWMWKKS